MRLLRLLRSPLSLPLAGALSMTTWLASATPHPESPTGEQGVVWVYVTSLCATPDDTHDCRRTSQVPEPSFSSRDACAMHLYADLARIGNPSMMGGCLRQREA